MSFWDSINYPEILGRMRENNPATEQDTLTLVFEEYLKIMNFSVEDGNYLLKDRSLHTPFAFTLLFDPEDYFKIEFIRNEHVDRPLVWKKTKAEHSFTQVPQLYPQYGDWETYVVLKEQFKKIHTSIKNLWRDIEVVPMQINSMEAPNLEVLLEDFGAMEELPNVDINPQDWI